jgi:hypothetical protein
MRDLPCNRIAGVSDSPRPDPGIACYEVQQGQHVYLIRFNLATIDEANRRFHELITLASMGSDLQAINWESQDQ